MNDWARLAHELERIPGIKDGMAAARVMRDWGYQPTYDPRALTKRLVFDIEEALLDSYRMWALQNGKYKRPQYPAVAGIRKRGKREASYFATCPRDDKGWCLPEGGAAGGSAPEDASDTSRKRKLARAAIGAALVGTGIVAAGAAGIIGSTAQGFIVPGTGAAAARIATAMGRLHPLLRAAVGGGITFSSFKFQSKLADKARQIDKRLAKPKAKS